MVDLDTLPDEAREWYDGLPECVQKRFHEYPPDRKYLLETSNHIVQLYSYGEDEDADGNLTCDTCQVLVLQKNNKGRLAIERRVFGIKFTDLRPVTDEFAVLFDRRMETPPPDMQAAIDDFKKKANHGSGLLQQDEWPDDA